VLAFSENLLEIIIECFYRRRLETLWQYTLFRLPMR